MFPQLEDVARDYDIKIVKVDVDSQRQLAGQFLAFVMPTILIINQGKEILREARFIDFHKIDRNLGLIFDQ